MILNDTIVVITFDSSVRLISLFDISFTLRIGIWNYRDIEIDMNKASEDGEVFSCEEKKRVKDLIRELLKTYVFYNPTNYSLKIDHLVQALIEEDFIIFEQDIHDVSNYLLGKKWPKKKKNSDNNALIIADNDFVLKSVYFLLREFPLKYESIANNVLRFLEDSSRYNAMNTCVDTEEHDVLEYLSHYDAVIVVYNNVNVHVLRNLNGLILHKKPVFLGFVDGPFMMYTSLFPGYTACFECLEQRLLSQVHDHVKYHEYLNLNTVYSNHVEKKKYVPIFHLISFAFQELILYNNTGMTKLMGRLLSIYIPSLEIHYQDVLRISSCDRCGYISEESNEMLNLHQRNVVREFLKD